METFLKIISLGLIERKHVDFKGTIDGWSYFARGFRAIPGLFLWGLLSTVFVGIPFYLSLIVTSMIMSISTGIKRFNAVFGEENAVSWFIGFFIYGIIASVVMMTSNWYLGYEGWNAHIAIAWLLQLGNVCFSIYVLAKDTNLKHEG